VVVHEDIEQALEEQAGIYAVAERHGDVITLSGLISSEAERDRALEIVAAMAPGNLIVDNLEIATLVAV